jgi:hypothetical protein
MEAIGRAIHQEHADSGLVLPLVQPMHRDLVRDVRQRLALLTRVEPAVSLRAE